MRKAKQYLVLLGFMFLAIILGNCSGEEEEANEEPGEEEEVTPEESPSGTTSTTIYSNDFNQSILGTYTETELASEWNNPSWNDGVTEGRVEIVAEEGEMGNSLKIHYPKDDYGTDSSGAQWQLDFGGTYEELYCSYWIKFSKDFDFVKGGKLPGLAGGEANTGGDKPDGTDGWSARIMWREEGAVVSYMYYPDQSSDDGEDFVWDEGGQRYFEPGVWHQVETRIVMNTPGSQDGIIQAWFDGELALDRDNIRFRDIEDLGIDLFYVSTFLGGNDSSWAPSQDQSILLDNVVISQNPITHE